MFNALRQIIAQFFDVAQGGLSDRIARGALLRISRDLCLKRADFIPKLFQNNFGFDWVKKHRDIHGNRQIYDWRCPTDGNVAGIGTDKNCSAKNIADLNKMGLDIKSGRSDQVANRNYAFTVNPLFLKGNQFTRRRRG